MFMLTTKEQNRHMSASPGSNEDNPDPNYEIRPVPMQDLCKKVDKYDKNGKFSLTCYLTSNLSALLDR